MPSWMSFKRTENPNEISNLSKQTSQNVAASLIDYILITNIFSWGIGIFNDLLKILKICILNFESAKKDKYVIILKYL